MKTVVITDAAFTGWNTYFAISPIPRFRKSYFSAVSELYKDTPMMHWIIPWK